MDNEQRLICPHCGSLKIDVNAKRVFCYGCIDCGEHWSGRYVICGDDMIIDAKTGKFIGYGDIKTDDSVEIFKTDG